MLINSNIQVTGTLLINSNISVPARLYLNINACKIRFTLDKHLPNLTSISCNFFQRQNHKLKDCGISDKEVIAHHTAILSANNIPNISWFIIIDGLDLFAITEIRVTCDDDFV